MQIANKSIRVAVACAVVASAAFGAVATSASAATAAPSTSTGASLASEGGTRAGTTSESVIARERVGGSAFELLQDGDQVFERFTTPGGVIGGEWTLVDTQLTPAGFELQNAGNWTDVRAAEAFGRVGKDVVRLVFHTASAGDQEASIAKGYWIAAWKGTDFTTETGFDYRATAYLADGTSFEIAS